LWAGGGVANRTRLWKTQRLEEIRDVKVGEFREVPKFRDNPEPSPDVASGKVQRLSAHHLKQKAKVMR